MNKNIAIAVLTVLACGCVGIKSYAPTSLTYDPSTMIIVGQTSGEGRGYQEALQKALEEARADAILNPQVDMFVVDNSGFLPITLVRVSGICIRLRENSKYSGAFKYEDNSNIPHIDRAQSSPPVQ